MSSSPSVYQGFQSCLEPFLMEPRVLSLKLSPPPPGSNLSITDPITNDDHDNNSWSSIQSLSNICKKTEGDENVYVHPTVKHSSSSMLSSKSLEMCTENLGCETGSSNGSDHMSLFSSEFSSCFIADNDATPVELVNRNSNSVSKRLNKEVCNKFPPLLTSLIEFGGVQVWPHREYGRLILEAVTSSSPQPYFQAERSNGRLRLQLFENVDDDADEEEEEEEEARDEEEYIGNEEDEMEITKFDRPRRCKENGTRDIFDDGYFELPSLSLCLSAHSIYY